MQFTLTNPLIITPRLLPGLQLGGAFISVETDCSQSYIDLANGKSHTVDDLTLGMVQRTDAEAIQHYLESLCSFLAAAAESYAYRIRSGKKYDQNDDSNEHLFPRRIVEWAHQHSDELSMLGIELEETKGLVK